jgi:hypothetical protein
VLSDLAVLAPPLLICAAFLLAVRAFLRYEMGHNDTPADDRAVAVSEGDEIPGQSDPSPAVSETESADRKDGPAAPGG